MRIGIDAAVMELPCTGIGKVTVGLYEACARLRPELNITVVHRRPLNCRIPTEFSTTQLGSLFPYRMWRNLILPLQLKHVNADVVHFPWNGDLPHLLPGSRIVTTVHDVLPLIIPEYFKDESGERLYKRRLQSDIDRSHLVITDSEFSKRSLLDHFTFENEPVVVSPASDIDRIPVDVSSAAASDEKYFLYVGGYDPRKGIEMLIKTLLALHKEGKIVSKLKVVGSRNYFSNGFKQLVYNACTVGVIEELDYVNESRLANLYRHAVALVYPSKFEGFGMPPLEAMKLGCPVITTRCTSLPEVCGDAVLYVDPDDGISLSDALELMEQNPDQSKMMRSKGLTQAARFSWDMSATRYLDVLDRLMRNDKMKSEK